MTEVKKETSQPKVAKAPATGWRAIKGYKRDYLFLNALKNRTVSADVVVAEGKKLGLKDVTCELKIRRWLKEGKAHKDSKGMFVFAK